jgi:hypothetical protein
VICEKSKFGVKEFALLSFEHLIFVKKSSWHLLLLEVKPFRWLGVVLGLPRLWSAMGKCVKVRFAYPRKEAIA